MYCGFKDILIQSARNWNLQKVLKKFKHKITANINIANKKYWKINTKLIPEKNMYTLHVTFSVKYLWE